jgi:tetratricopeptide (TPR) repeat protein
MPRYLATNDSAGNRDTVLSVAYIAWEKWDNKEEAPLIHAYILARGSDQDLWNGEFQNGLQKAHDALDLALKYLDPDNERVVQYNSDYGIAFGSAGNYKRGADFLSRAEEFFNADPERYGVAKGILINANMSRNSYCNGDFEDAENRLNRTLEMSREIGSLYWEALYVFDFWSIYFSTTLLDLSSPTNRALSLKL